jgi:hypothetical protein
VKQSAVSRQLAAFGGDAGGKSTAKPPHLAAVRLLLIADG